MEASQKSKTGCSRASRYAGALGVLRGPEQEELKLGFEDLGQMQIHGEERWGIFIDKAVS